EYAFFQQIYDADGSAALSGGERNLQQLKTLCSTDAAILLLDEPGSHLDIYAQAALEKAVADYRGTVVMVSHDFYTVTGCADRILLLENGTLREMSGRAYRKSVYKKYFDSDIFEQERLAKEKEMRINALIASRKYREARELFETL
ncbi:MAG: ABC transporter ATP-binding protein, partial [Firmicutes bacterium]|nr:ABC transporter ATP-binding protein [Bacillota bacterium]